MRGQAKGDKSPKFHVEGWHPATAAFVGASGFLVLAMTVLGALLWTTRMPLEPSWSLPVLVTSLGAGGAAGLTLKNLNLKRAESRRSTNVMFDGQFETGARLLGGNSESEVLAGSLLLGSLLRESPRHAQACADLLCAALRRQQKSDLTSDELAEMLPDIPESYFADRTIAIRMRNALAAAIKRAATYDASATHLRSVRWDFEGTYFGDRADLSGCIFGPGTRFKDVIAVGLLDLSHSRFVGSCGIVNVSAPQGLHMGHASVERTLYIEDSAFGQDSDANFGVFLLSVVAGDVQIHKVCSRGSLHLDDASIRSEVDVGDSVFRSLSFTGASSGGAARFLRLRVDGDFTVANVTIRKGFLVESCSATGDFGVRGVHAGGRVVVRDSMGSTTVVDEPSG